MFLSCSNDNNKIRFCIEYEIIGEGFQISTNQKPGNSAFSLLIGQNLRPFPDNFVLLCCNNFQFYMNVAVECLHRLAVNDKNIDRGVKHQNQGWRNWGGQGGHGPPKNLSGRARVCFGPPKILTTGPPKMGPVGARLLLRTLK